MSEKPTSVPVPRPMERKDRHTDVFRRDSPAPKQPVATPKPPTQPKRETVRTGPKKGP